MATVRRGTAEGGAVKLVGSRTVRDHRYRRGGQVVTGDPVGRVWHGLCGMARRGGQGVVL
jgi:hypothetical protein